MKRVYHPTAKAWQDVPDSDVEAWSDQGWLKSKPKHFADVRADELPPVGEGYVNPPVVLNDAPGGSEDLVVVDAPGGNASADEWREYARTQGASDEDLEGLSRDDLRAAYGGTE